MIPGMARSTWNVSGDTVTLEEGPKRSPSRWLRQNSLKLALLLGIAEAIFALVTGHRLLIMLIGIVSAIVYFNVRSSIPARIKRPIWIVVAAQIVAGLVVPAIYAGILIFSVVAALLLIVLLLVMLGDLRR